MFGKQAFTAMELEAERRRETIVSDARGSRWPGTQDAEAGERERSTASDVGRGFVGLAWVTGDRPRRTTQRA